MATKSSEGVGALLPKKQPRCDNYIEAAARNLARKTCLRPLRGRGVPRTAPRSRLTKGEFTRFAPDDYTGWIIQNKLDERVFVRMYRAKSGLPDSRPIRRGRSLLLKNVNVRKNKTTSGTPPRTICTITQLYIVLTSKHTMRIYVQTR